MIIEVLEQKYRVGCNRGMAKIERPYMLTELNLIIEWKLCKFPEVLDENALPKDENGKPTIPEDKEELKKYIKEDRTFLGDEPELKPGDTFLFRGQVIAVNSETELVLVVSETGRNSLERVYEEEIKPEVDMIFNDFEIESVEYEESKMDEIPDNFERTTPEYKYYKIWKDHFIAGRYSDDSELCIKCKVDTGDLVYPATIYMLKWAVMYDPEEFMNEEHAKNIIVQAISWFYENESREENKEGD